MHRINVTCLILYGAILAASGCTADPRLEAARAAVKAALPPSVAREAIARIDANPTRFLDLLAQTQKNEAATTGLLIRVDKATPLPEGFVPANLVGLDGTGLSVSRPGHQLRKPAIDALLAMDKAARTAGVVLVVGSAYRSYGYQVEVFARTAKQEGSEAAAERISARPGKSQHQLGMALDFSPIDDSFALTKASQWLAANAERFGFSLSYPKGFESVTGYSWESWHWRFIGKAACELQKEYFGDIQQYLILFMETWKASK